MKRTASLLLLCTLVCACRKPEPFDDLDTARWFAGGQQTVFVTGNGAYSQPFPNMSEAALEIHDVGDLQFEATFVSAPAPTNAGLGPVFNSVSCASCHIADGRGTPGAVGGFIRSLLFRISIPGEDEHGGPLAVPGFGSQLQHRAIADALPEADMEIAYVEVPGSYGDGSPFSLRQPAYSIGNAYTSWPSGAMLSPRLAPPVFGLGLLEAIDEGDVLAGADPGDADGDGISGRANMVWDPAEQRARLGRFGWKSGAPSLLVQTAGAYHQDMGITSPLFPQEASAGQPQADGYPDDPELSDSLLHAVAFYVRTLAVPGRRDADDPEVMRGEQLFTSARCDRCHVPEQHTAVNVAFPGLSNQRIFPYTDLLLHEMGEGLADGRPDFLADGREWRTAPLWGLGLSQVVNGHEEFLHDGRARGMEEAVLWHGGEAQFSRDQFAAMSAADRAALIAFLRSL